MGCICSVLSGPIWKKVTRKSRMSFPFQPHYKIARSLRNGPKSIYAYHNHQIPLSTFVVQIETGKGEFAFTSLPNAQSLFDYVQKAPVEKRNYFEWILGDRRRKPYFDIDVECSMSDVKATRAKLTDMFTSLTEALLLLGDEYGVDFEMERDMLVFESSGEKANTYKFSYHIIINNWYLENPAQSKQFATLVRTYMAQQDDPKLSEWAEALDMSVYNSGRAFRMYSCSKFGTTRVLRFLPHWRTRQHSYTSVLTPSGNKKAAQQRIFFASLITLTFSCAAFPELELPKKREYKTVSVDDEMVAQALQLLDDCEEIDNSAMELRNITDGGLILLDTHEPYMCPSCGRVHDSDNPYIRIQEDGVYFSCRRSRYYLGDIISDELLDEEEERLTSATDTLAAAKKGEPASVTTKEGLAARKEEQPSDGSVSTDEDLGISSEGLVPAEASEDEEDYPDNFDEPLAEPEPSLEAPSIIKPSIAGGLASLRSRHMSPLARRLANRR